MMRLSDKPPSYDELFPPSQEFTKLPEKYLDKLTRDTPCHSTYFSRTCQWGDMVGFYRGELDWKGRRSGRVRNTSPGLNPNSAGLLNVP